MRDEPRALAGRSSHAVGSLGMDFGEHASHLDYERRMQAARSYCKSERSDGTFSRSAFTDRTVARRQILQDAPMSRIRRMPFSTWR